MKRRPTMKPRRLQNNPTRRRMMLKRLHQKMQQRRRQKQLTELSEQWAQAC